MNDGMKMYECVISNFYKKNNASVCVITSVSMGQISDLPWPWPRLSAYWMWINVFSSNQRHKTVS